MLRELINKDFLCCLPSYSPSYIFMLPVYFSCGMGWDFMDLFLFPKGYYCKIIFYKNIKNKSWWMKAKFELFLFLYNSNVRNKLLINESSWWISDVENLTEENPKVMKYSLLYLCVSLGWKESNPYNKCLVKFGKSCFSLVLREKQT